MALLFDCETNGLLDDLDRVHCMVVKDTLTGERSVFNERGTLPSVEAGVRLLEEASRNGTPIVAHNAIKFDVPALQKVYPWFNPDPKHVTDTLILSRLIYPDLQDADTKLKLKGKLPGNLFKSHSLEAWGHRLGCFKGDFKGPWAVWTQDMEDYCVQDVEVLDRLWQRLMAKNYAAEAMNLEHGVAWIIARQERYGFAFDKDAAVRLYRTLVSHKLETERRLTEVFTPRYLQDGHVKVPAATARRQVEELGLDAKGKKYKTMDFTKGCSYTKVKLVEFNPGSRDHIALWLKRMYGWKPEEFTNDGKPKIDETTLNGLPYPEAKLLQSYLMIEKRIGQVAEGKEAWLKKEQLGRMHGRVITNGAVTGRMTHSGPNMGQVPASYSPFGKECRACFTVTDPLEKVLVGADASALELCDLAGYMARYDGGTYIKTVLEGDKKQGTDIHSVNARALGLDPTRTYFEGTSGRDLAKTWFYAFIYGAGDEKLGSILTQQKGADARKRGSKSRAAFMRGLPALGKLVEVVKQTVKQRGHLFGLDGRVLHIRSQHSALNTLLQSAGAVQMKKALVILDDSLQALGYVPGINYEFVANVHDEWQIECDIEIGECVGQEAVAAIQKAGAYFNFRCPLSGEYRVGRTWAETH